MAVYTLDCALPLSGLLLPVQFNEREEQQFGTLKALAEEPICSTSSFVDLLAQFNKCEEQQSVSSKLIEEKPVCSTSNYTQVKALGIIKQLKSKGDQQKKKIKRLNDKVRRQGKKIADIKTVMKDLKENYVTGDHN